MLKKTIIIAMFALLPSFVFAQAVDQSLIGPAKHEMPNKGREHFDKISQELSLTDEQKEKFHAVLKEQHEKMKALHDETTSRLTAILTPDQLGKFEQMRQAQKQRMHEMADQAHRKVAP